MAERTVRRMWKRAGIQLCSTLIVALLAACAAPRPMTTAPPAPTPPPALELTGYTSPIHDPVIAKDGALYVVFSTGSGIPMVCSKDLRKWEFCGRAFERNPAWIADAVPGTADLWAPDIAFFNGQWHLYYSASTFGKNRSAIGLATNATLDPSRPEYKWEDRGMLLASSASDAWNAIDPNLVLDAAGQPWLAFGSYWSGLKLRKLDAAARAPAADDTTLRALAGGRPAPNAIEAPFMFRRGEFVYLFFSADYCCRGADSTYNIRVGRAREITGPYIDRAGVLLLQGGGTLVSAGGKRWRGPGHNAVFSDGGKDWLVHHAYDAEQVGRPNLRIRELTWDAQGWPIASPEP